MESGRSPSKSGGCPVASWRRVLAGPDRYVRKEVFCDIAQNLLKRLLLFSLCQEIFGQRIFPDMSFSFDFRALQVRDSQNGLPFNPQFERLACWWS